MATAQFRSSAAKRWTTARPIWVPVVALLSLLCLYTRAYAQPAVYYDPNAQQSQQAPANEVPGYGQSPSASPGAANGDFYTPGSGGLQPNVSNGGFSPTVLPNYQSPSLQEPSDNQVIQPGGAGAIAQPLYARPATTPGQFELFTRPPPEPGEFEKYVEKALGQPLPRFGADLILKGGRGFATPPTTTVPPDYRLNPGDELIIDVTGSVEAHLLLTIDSEGRIFIPRLGPINVAGVRYGELADAIARRFNEQYKQARVSVVIGHLHGITIYVTGYAVSPGAYTMSSLSTMVDAVLAAGGPTAGGSFRTIELRRNGQLLTTLDLYDLLLKGDKTHDAVLQNDDVLDIEPAGPELAITGSVNFEAIYEAKPGETLADIIRYAGGLNSLADDKRLVLVRLGDLDLTGSRELSFAQAQTFPAERGDIVRILSLADIVRPRERQAILATIDGEVDHPGRYYLKPGSTLADLIAQANGLTSGAFVFGADFSRESVRRQQQVSFDKAIDDLEVDAAAAPISALASADNAASAQARQQASLAVIQHLKERKPDGRLVLDTPYEAIVLPGALALEDNDHIYIPPRPTTVGVFGAVYRTGSFLFRPGGRIGDYLKMTGGAQRFADRGATFVVRANGAVVSARQVHDLNSRPALPGDVIYVPVQTGPSLWEKLKEIAQVVFQFGLGAAALAVLAHQ